MVKVRFAPSPTGHLHVGNTRTALMNYLFARKEQGKLVLRIEDTDIERSAADYETSIVDDLRWLGIFWDEGPVRQTDRLAIYRAYAENLLERGCAYRCYCSGEELERKRKEALHKGEPPRYDGTCRDLSPEARKQIEGGGRPFVLRFKAPAKPVHWTDGICGDFQFPQNAVDDFILLKQSGIPSYNFAAAVDDAEMGITHVIRGADHVPNTPKQIMLIEAFGKTPPQYAHHSLLLGDDKKPLSKRHGITGVRDFRETGILESALVNYLGVLGRGIPQEIMTEEELTATFSLSSFSPSDTIFDINKLIWFNKEYLRNIGPEEIIKRLGLHADCRDRVLALRENVSTLKEMNEHLRIFDDAAMNDEGRAYLSRVGPPDSFVRELRGLLIERSVTAFDDLIRAVEGKAGFKRKDLFMILRIFFTGRKSGPPLKDIFHLIPKDIIIERIDRYLADGGRA
ncbi:MAG: Glutamate--tRNA ligase 1 [Syntrophorhabdus sp. PtaU1.Bin058]|nr:MAG: Glutamate--tRNA ligase 1 [Syntrophorhabdus sp. PtaU1.Bin058]